MHIVRCARHLTRMRWWADFMKFYLHYSGATIQAPETNHDVSMRFLLSVCREVDWATYLHQVKLNAIPRVKYHTPAWMMGPEPTQKRIDRIMRRRRTPDYERKYRCRTCKGLNCGLSCISVDNGGVQKKPR